MKTFCSLLLLMLMTGHVLAKESSKTLNDAVNQAKSYGQVLSAKTVDGRHEVKVLTPNGSVKTIRQQSAQKKQRPNYFQNGGRSMRDRKTNPVIPNRFNNSRQTQTVTPAPTRQTRSAATKSTSKEKDK